MDTLAAPGAGRGLTLLCPAGTHDRPGHRHPAPIHVPGTPPSCLPRAAQISEDIPHHSPGRPEGTAAPGTQHSPSRCSAHTGPGPLALLHFSRPQSAADSAPPRATWRPTASTSLGNAAGAPGFSMTTKDSARERHWQPRRPREGPGQGVRPRPNGHLGKAPRPASSLPTRTWVGSPAEAKAPAAHPQPTDSLCARHLGQDPAEALELVQSTTFLRTSMWVCPLPLFLVYRHSPNFLESDRVQISFLMFTWDPGLDNIPHAVPEVTFLLSC